MIQALRWLVILGIMLIAGGIWKGFQDREGGQSPRFDVGKSAHADAPPIRDTWGQPATLADHFARHGPDFQARDAEDYARQAHLFLQRAYSTGLPAKRDAEGTLRVFDPRAGIFGAYNRDGTTRTFFKPGSSTYFQRQPGQSVELRSQPRP